MQRLPLIDPADADARLAPLFHKAEAMFGRVPNVARTAANSPAALEALLGFLSAMGGAGVEPALQSRLLLSVSEQNACDYCTALLTHELAPGAGLSPADILGNRRGEAGDARSAAALRFAQAVLASRGRVADADLAAVRAAGFTPGEVTELVATVALGCFTNFLNNVAETTLDVERAEAVAA